MEPPNPKRKRQADTHYAVHVEPPEPQNALYHFRMALHYSLQNVRFRIGRFADRVRMKRH